MILSNVAKVDIGHESQHIVDAHRHLLTYYGVDQVLDRGHGRLLLQMNIDWENAPDGFVAWEEACDKVYLAYTQVRIHFKDIDIQYELEWIPHQKAIPEP